jgi:HAD superfamily hydrolase (TIGR01549 family)
MKKYILLDWDGNLAKTLHIWLEAFRVPLGSRGIDISDEEIISLGVEDYDVAMDEADTYAKQKMPEVELYPDAIEVLEALHQNDKRLALITSTYHSNVDNLLDKYNMTSLFDLVIASDDVINIKPDPEPINKALEFFDCSKGDAVMIGDSDKDILAARNAGIDSILFYPPEHKIFYKLGDLEKLEPTHVVDDFRKILGIV